MVAEYIRYQIDDDDRASFEAAYHAAGTALEASSHCLAFELSHCTDHAPSYVLRIEWDSIEGHMHGFRGSPEFQEFFAAIKPYVSNITEMRHYEPTAVRWRRERTE